MKANISYTLENNLCLGCGLCADACPTQSISMQVVNGEYRPRINQETCNNKKGCHRCESVCAGLGIEINRIGKQNANEVSHYHPLVGWYQKAYSGYACDNDVRWHAASGGGVSAFVAFLLDKGFVSAAVVAENDVSQPFLNKVRLVHNSRDLWKARSSKYCPVTYEGIVKQIKKDEKSVVVIGLPCAIHGFRKFIENDQVLKGKIFGLLGLYCSGRRSFNHTEYVLKQNKIDVTTLSYFQYRDEGCLGSLVAQDSSKQVKIPYQLFYHPLRSIFIPNRCQFCVDHYSELADVSFGDIHYGKYKEDKIGVNSLVVRNEKFDILLKAAEEEGYIKLEALNEDELIKCQQAATKKKGRVGGVLRFAKTLGLKIPDYDVELKNYSYLKSIAYYLFAKSQMFVGRRRWLWWIIPLIAKKGKVD